MTVCENCGQTMAGRIYKGKRFCSLRCYGDTLRTSPEDKLLKYVQRRWQCRACERERRKKTAP